MALTAELVTRKVAGKSIFTVGSGNPGMANVMTEYGFGPGITVLIGDLTKTVLACCLCRFVLPELLPQLYDVAAAGTDHHHRDSRPASGSSRILPRNLKKVDKRV